MGLVIRKGILFLVCLSGVVSSSLWANDALIKELESLRGTLRPGDASRPTLTRRLADMYFDAAMAMDKDNILKGIVTPTKKLKKYRKKGISLYHEALTGGQRKHNKKMDKGLEIKIWFQLARLYFASGKKQKAVFHYKKLLADKNVPTNLAREASLQMAEHMEGVNRFEDSYKYYRRALELCSADICSYANYRLAWLFYRQQMYSEAVAEGRKSLWDAKGLIREYALKDFIVFLSNMPGDGSEQSAEVDKLANVLKHPSLLRDLAMGFFAVGNNRAGTSVLAEVNDRNPAIRYQMRLAEEYYGLRDWQKLRSLLDQMMNHTSKSLPSDKEIRAEIRKTLKRLIVQLDGEQHGRQQSKDLLQDSIFIYLSLYPKDLAMREKLIDGWLAVEDDVGRKIQQLAVWIEEENQRKNKKEQIRLRKIRLSLAQELKDQQMTIDEGLALSRLLANPQEARHHLYLVARIYYEQKEYEKAKDLFIKLAKQGNEATLAHRPDKWAVQSQHLLLDILNAQRQYSQILTQANAWLENSALRNDPALTKELATMQRIYEQAEFEWAVTQGEVLPALRIFEKNCFEKKFGKKACINAKVLAVKLGRQKSLVKLLKILGDEKSLASEYELMGNFSEAASLIEKKKPFQKSSIPAYLKVSLFYELDQDVENRNRILNKMISRLKREKKIDPKLEPLIYKTLVDAGFWGTNLWFLPWNENYRKKLIIGLEAEGKGNKHTRKLLTSSKVSMGPAWTEYILNSLVKLDQKQRRKKFHGKRSKKRFQQRLDSIGKLADLAKAFLPGADASTRVYIAHLLDRSYRHLVDEIEATPIPAIIEDKEQIAKIKANLKQMTSPFAKESDNYRKIKEEQLKQIPFKLQESIVSLLDASPKKFAEALKVKRLDRPSVETLNLMEIQSQLQVLQERPNNKNAIEAIHRYYVKNKRPRLAAYFEGRLGK